MADYTSNSEFDLETRVQITNEMPSTRDYEMMHHSLRNDTWKWLIGTEDVTYDLPVGGSTSRNLEAPVKIVNGTQAANYGPSVTQKWDPTTESYVDSVPTFHKMEITGVLAVEHDLFLHEIYRYLNCLYPDHPDWLNLLTRNEILDAFNNAAAMVDYKPNNAFFKLVADSIQADDPDTEEFKLNLRNLKSNAARRKFYGSMLGFRMMGHDAYENVSIFPVAKALTLNAVNKDEWKENKAAGFDAKSYIIDTFDERYQTLFRRIDWLGNNRDTSFTQSNGYTYSSYTLGGYEDIQFEFVSSTPGDSTADAYQLNSDSAYSFYDLTAGSSTETGSVSDVETFNTWEPKLGSTLQYVSSDDKLYGVKTSLSSAVRYHTLYKYKTFEEIVKLLQDNDIETAVMTDYNNRAPFADHVLTTNEDWFSVFVRSVASVIEAYGGIERMVEEVDYSYNPIIRDTISLPIDVMRDCYPTSVDFNADGTAINRTAELDLTNATIHKGDIVSLVDYASDPKPLVVAGGTCGQIRAKIKSPAFSGARYNAISSYSPFDVTKDDIISNDNYGFIITLKDDTYAVVYGSINITWQVLADGNIAYSLPETITLNIRAIPEQKPQGIFEYLYGTDADDSINTVKADIKAKEKELSRHRALVVQDCNGDSTYMDLYESLPTTIANEEVLVDEKLDAIDTAEDKDAAKAEYDKAYEQLEIDKESYNSVVEYLEDKAYSNFTNYKECADEIAELNETLEEYQEAKNELLKNRELLITSDRCSNITTGSSVKLFTIGSMGEFSILPYILDNVYITEFSFGNVSLQQILLDSRTTEIDIGDKWVFATYDTVQLRDDYLYQLYAHLDAASRNAAYSAISSMKIYNESEFNVTAQVYVDKSVGSSCYEVQFLTDDARTKYDSLSVGSKVYGPGIAGDTYVTKLSNYVATLSSPLPKGGSHTFTFTCSVTTSPASVADDPFNYKKVMYANGEYDKESFFDHGVYGTDEWPKTEKAIMDGDLKDKQILNPTTFFKVVKKLYSDKLTDENNLLIPSVAKNTREVFVEVNADHLIDIENTHGDTENLMNVEWLDYLASNTDETALAKESINVGCNLILGADTSGYASLMPGAEYTDPNLKILFQTNNWSDGTVPAYVQIGTGGSGLKKFFKLVSNIQYPNVYGATFWDKSVEPYTDTEGVTHKNWITENDELDVRKRATYSNVDNNGAVSDDYSTYENIDEPLFEIPLNEYNINLEYYPDNRKFTTIDIMFYEQTFKNLTKECELGVGLQSALSSDLFDKNTFSGAEFTSKSLSDTRIKSDTSNNVYYHLSDGNDEDLDKGDLQVVYNDDETWIDYDVLVGGCIGRIPYYYNKITYKVVNTSYSYTISDFSSKKLTADTYSEFLKRWLIIKAIVSSSTNYSTLLSEYTDNFLGYGSVTYDKFFDDLTKYKSVFENKLILFTYFSGNFDKNGEDVFGLSDFDVLGLFWANDKINLVKINKNYTLCSVLYGKETLISENEYNLFYGYNVYPIITYEGQNRHDTAPEDFKLEMATTDQWLFDLSSSIMNYTSKVFNTIDLPRKRIADGSYEINMFLDPHFIAEGYRYKDYLKSGTDASTVKYCISQSAIRYDKDNDLFYTNSCIVNDEGDIETSIKDDADYIKGLLN